MRGRPAGSPTTHPHGKPKEIFVTPPRGSRGRRPLAELFRSEADIVPDPESGILRVRILGTASNAGDAAIAGLLEELNQTRTVFPGTGLRMVYELPGNDARAEKPAS